MGFVWKLGFGTWCLNYDVDLSESARSEDLPFLLAALVGFPKPQAAKESVFVFAALDSFRQLIEPVHIAAAEDDIIGNKRFLQLHNCENHFPFPFFFAKSFDSRNAGRDEAGVIWPLAPGLSRRDSADSATGRLGIGT